jgi:type VI secretion system protein ImpJ
MSAHNRVVWSEGLFLQPQHFQQQDRYLERYIESRCESLIPHSWGFTDVAIERDFLKIGKFGVQKAAGVFPDGTPVRIPADDPPPEPLEIDAETRDQVIYLAVPLRREGSLEVDRTGSSDELARQTLRQWDVRDVTAPSGTSAAVEVSAVRSRLLLARDVTPAYACLPLAHLVECRSDKQVILDDSFMPTVLHARASTRLAAFMTELQGLLHQRGEALAGRVAATSRGGSAEIAEFLLLQAVNRYEPIVAHYAQSGAVHPEEFFRFCVSVAGELGTFSPSKRPPTLGGYRHDQLRESFEPVIAALRSSMSAVIEQRAIQIPIEEKKYGIRVATVADRSLYTSAVFVLAARADMPAEELRRRFPSQLKIAPVEKIRELVNLALKGVPVQPLPVAPRQIPFHAGFVYFELDQTHELWVQLRTSGGVALFVGGEFPGLALEFWAIRG